MPENYRLMGYKVAELGRNAREFLLLRRGPWPSEEALRYQHTFVADMQEMEVMLASGEEDSKIKSIGVVQDEQVDGDGDDLTISFIMGSDDNTDPLDMVAPNSQTIIIVHPEPEAEVAHHDLGVSAHQQHLHMPVYNPRELPAAPHSSRPGGHPGLALPFGSSSHAFINNLEDMALELMTTAQPVPFPPPILPPQSLHPREISPAFSPSVRHPREAGQGSHRRHQVGGC